MRQMKDSGIEWIGEIPAEWEVRPLFSLFEERKCKNFNLKESNVLSLSYGKIVERDVETNMGLLPESFETYNIVEHGNIILRLTDLQNDKTSLRTGLVTRRGIITSAYIAIESKNDVQSSFFSYLLHTYDTLKVFYMMGNGVRQNLKFTELSHLPLLIPPLDEQQRIADYLDAQCARIDEIMELVRQSKEKLRAYKLSLITEAVTRGLDPDVPMKDSGIPWIGEIPTEWKMINLGKYVDLLPGFAFSSSIFHPEAGIKLLRGTNLGVHIVRWNDTLYYNGEINEKTNQFILSENDMVIGMDRPWISDGLRIAILKKEDTPCLLVQRLCKICSKNIFNKFLFYIFISDIFKNSIAGTMTGVSIPHISANQIANCRIPLPPLPEQERIAAYLDEKCARVDALLAEKDELLDKLAAYKKSLIYECVTGKREVAA